MKSTAIATSLILLATTAGAMTADQVRAMDQDMSGGTVMAESVMAEANGWLVVHRTDSEMKPGPVVGYAPLRAGENKDVVAILQETVQPGEMLMLMVHGESGGVATGVFEYTLGAKEDGPVRVDGNLIMTVVTAK